MPTNNFFSLYSHGFARMAVAVPPLAVADVDFNLQQTLDLARQAAEAGAVVTVFPELGLTGYSNDDLFHQSALLEAAKEGLKVLLQESKNIPLLMLVGMPLAHEDQLFNVAVAVLDGRILGVIPKTYLPNYREFYEKRQFASAADAHSDEIILLGQRVPFGSQLIFVAGNFPGFKLSVEICEDLWSPLPPSTLASLAGATVIANLSASNATIGKADYRREICAAQSGKCVAAYLYSAAGQGESTTDLAWDGHAMIFENGRELAQSERYCSEAQLMCADIDLERLSNERMRLTSFRDTARLHKSTFEGFHTIKFTLPIPEGKVLLQRELERFPYVPASSLKRDERCFEAYHIQVQGLTKRLKSSGLEKIVIGVSGGLDSTHALIVAVRAMDLLGWPRENILAYTMPGFATSDHTLKNARDLMKSLKVTASELDIRPSCEQMLRDIGHPFSDGKPVHDVTFENVQAGERTSHLFRLANLHNAMVLGTGDLSELALGWCTYGVGDHMSHYNPNASVPKTLIQYLLRWIIETEAFDKSTLVTLQSIVDTEISPELIPHSEGDSSAPAQSTESAIGPYELHDFFLYYITRFGFSPSKVAFLAHAAWSDCTRGGFPHGFPADKQNEYTLAEIKKWMNLFLKRFFANQFKRSCIPNGPKVGSGGSLSPRGDWRMPSDANGRVWLDELRENVPDCKTSS
jgi:NAD+ synthase (glutamine-hydrolysing)